jgi:hypothetical protein
MEDKRSIKKVLESQGDVHEKVANQSNSELLSLSPTRSQDHLVFKLMSRLHTTSVLDVQHMHGKLRI